MGQYTVYLILAPAALLLLSICLIFALVNIDLKKYFGLPAFTACVLAFIVLNIFELKASSRENLLVISHLSYGFITFMPVFWLVFCQAYSAKQAQFFDKRLILLLLVPLLTTVFAWTNDQLHFIWIDYHIVSEGDFLINRVKTYGFWFWIHFVYSYTLYLIGSFKIFTNYFTLEKSARHEALISLFAVSLPLSANLVYVFRLFPGITRDFSPLIYAISSLLFLISISKQKAAALETERSKHNKPGSISSDQLSNLSKRELEIYRLLCLGYSNKELSETLFISENTAKTHVRKILQKLDIQSRKQVLDYSINQDYNSSGNKGSKALSSEE